MKLRSNGVEQFLSTLQIDGVEMMKIGKLIMRNEEYKKSVSKIFEITEPVRESETMSYVVSVKKKFSIKENITI